MKKGHWIVIVVLCLISFGSIMFAVIKDISAKRTYDYALESQLKNRALEKAIENQKTMIDSLILEIDRIKK